MSVVEDVLTRVPASEYLRVLREEHLAEYLPSGGASIRFVAADGAALSDLSEELQALARQFNLFHVHLDAGQLDENGRKPDLHRIDKLFFALLQNVDLKGWAAEQARRYLNNSGLRLAEGRALDDLDGIAEDNGRDRGDLYNQYQRDLTDKVVKDPAMCGSFRTAVAALVRAQLIPEAMTPTTEEVLLSWFSGKTMPGAAAALKRVRIFDRITQSNARAMMQSLCHWVPQTGKNGTLLVLDFRAYQVKKLTRPQADSKRLREAQEAAAQGDLERVTQLLLWKESGPAVTYSETAYMHMLSTLRRFVDEIDWFERLLIVVLTTPSFYVHDPAQRNFHDYDALQTRIGLEVRDRVRANPAASLVFL